MAMLRPSGKALKIAKQTVPGLRSKDFKNSAASSGSPKPAVEEMQIEAIGDLRTSRKGKFS